MLRKIVNFALGILLITAVIIAPIVVAGDMDTHYKISGIVKSVDNGIIYVVDTEGEEWGFTGDGFTRGDKIMLTFFNNYTEDTRYDDVIDKVSKK